MPINTNSILSYLAILSVAGFFLWIIGSIVKSLRHRGDTGPTAITGTDEPEDGELQATVAWPIHVFLSPQDDLPLPGQVTAVNPAGAFLECSVCLDTGQEFSMYIDVPFQEQVRVTAEVLWARECHGGKSGAQVRFLDLDPDKRMQLFRLAGEHPRMFVAEE